MRVFIAFYLVFGFQILGFTGEQDLKIIQDPKMDCNKKKVNLKGEYCPFQGFTIISFVGNKNKKMWSKIYQDLNKSKLIKNHYALLPVSSYHMTILNLYYKDEINGDWDLFIKDHLTFFQKLNRRIRKDPFYPQMLKLEPELSGQTIKLVVQIEEPLKEKINSLANEYSLINKVPNKFHITLGYLYKGAIPKGKKNEVLIKFKSILDNILKSTTYPLPLQESKLTYFTSMMEFIPWDGKNNPFQNKKKPVAPIDQN